MTASLCARSMLEFWDCREHFPDQECVNGGKDMVFGWGERVSVLSSFFASQNFLVPSPSCWLSGASCCRTRSLNVFCSVCICAWLRTYSLCALPGGVQLHQKQCEWQHVLWWAVFRSSPLFFFRREFLEKMGPRNWWAQGGKLVTLGNPGLCFQLSSQGRQSMKPVNCFSNCTLTLLL